MKLLIGSDIHGDRQAAERLIDAFIQSRAHYLICLGDLLYHGPRNAIPEHYHPQAVAELLNEYRLKILAVRGNCDSEVDQMLCQFPILSDYQQLLTDSRRIFFTHGHLYRSDNLPPLALGDLFVSGHTHLPIAEYGQDGIYRLNPGSVAIPRGDWSASYALLDDDHMQICDLCTHQVLLECALTF
ncbi:phosphodiesterase [Celerinatantimonas yamalensis]|uniref:Phosphoesterase n=1 Tax=Celerinatantimonas yamalensis TaxID=559956 RepID=A0ABW9G239_9GAMM